MSKKRPGNWGYGALSFFIPGSGQFLQGRYGIGLAQLIFSVALWFIFMGWIGHLWAALDAAYYNPATEHFTHGHP